MKYHNIETKKFPGRDYYVGYANIGCVRIKKTPSGWKVVMGKSLSNEALNIVGLYVGTWKTLKIVSQRIQNLSIRNYIQGCSD